LTDGILRAMNMRELTGILAHELNHVRGNDMRVMGMADIISRMTTFLSLAGQILLLINLPLLLTGQLTISWWLILLLIISPNAVALLQLGLSRSREFNADLDAARLTGDPKGLASALSKLERAERSLLSRLLMPGRKVPVPSVLRTHPDTRERVRRLLELESQYPAHPFGDDRPSLPGDLNRPPRRPPRRRWTGLWY
jgi:heat shock protein HtpX